MIIVEGIDRVGKTTLINKIHEELGIPIVGDTYLYDTKDMRDSARVNTEKIVTMLNFAKNVDDNFIVDRLHWSEYVYGICDRGYVNIDVFELEKKLIDIDAKIILVQPTDVEESSRQHGKSLSKHLGLFNGLFEESQMDKFKCDYNTLSDAVEWVKEHEKHNIF